MGTEKSYFPHVNSAGEVYHDACPFSTEYLEWAEDHNLLTEMGKEMLKQRRKDGN